MSRATHVTVEEMWRVCAQTVDELRLFVLKTHGVLSNDSLDAHEGAEKVRDWSAADGTCCSRTCLAFLDDLRSEERFGCTLPKGHDGPHRDTCYVSRRPRTIAEWDAGDERARIVPRPESNP